MCIVKMRRMAYAQLAVKHNQHGAGDAVNVLRRGWCGRGEGKSRIRIDRPQASKRLFLDAEQTAFG